MSSDQGRIWFGRPTIALESYMDLLQRVAQLELLVKLALDGLDLIQHAQRLHKGQSTVDDVSRETEEVDGQLEIPLSDPQGTAAPEAGVGTEEHGGRKAGNRRKQQR